MTKQQTGTARAKKPVFPIRALFLLLQKYHLLVIDGEAFAIKGKEHRHITSKDYEALLSLAWITPAHVIAEGLFSHEVTPAGQGIATQIEEQNRQFKQLSFDLPEFKKVEQTAVIEPTQVEPAPVIEATQAEQAVAIEAAQTEPATTIETTQAEQTTTTNKRGKRPDYRSEEAKAARAAKRAAIQKNVQQGVSKLLAEIKAGKTEHLLNYLKFSSRFHRYSPLNQMLIAMQAPHATLGDGFSTWKKQGYNVRRGETGIAILAPHPYGKTVLKNQNTGEETITYLGATFTIAHVFDVSQLEGRPDKLLPDFFVPLADNQEALYTAIAQAVQEEGIQLEIGETKSAQGYSTGGTIRLKNGLDSTNRVLTLIHEWAHEKLHHNDKGRAMMSNKRELHAEATSYIVAHHFGIHNPFSSDYLQQWGNNEKEFLAELETIKVTANAIIEQIEALTS